MDNLLKWILFMTQTKYLMIKRSNVDSNFARNLVNSL